MRIVHVSDGYTPRVGGIEVQVAGLAAAQAAAGHQVDVVTVTRGRGDANGSPVRVHRLTGPTGPDRIAAVLRAARPEVVNVHASLVSPLAVMASTHDVRARLPTVITMHSLWGPSFVPDTTAWTGRSGGATGRRSGPR